MGATIASLQQRDLVMRRPDPAGSSTSAPPAPGPSLEHPFSWRFTTPLFIGSALNPINSSLIATALVPIARGLDVRIGRTVALVTALYLASAIAGGRSSSSTSRSRSPPWPRRWPGSHPTAR
jgi:hypothetical protein